MVPRRPVTRRLRQRAPTLLLVVLCLAAVAAGSGLGPVQAYSGGPPPNAAKEGCLCHGTGAPDTSVLPTLEGLPENYTPGGRYVLNISIQGDSLPPVNGNAGGFNLIATKGRFHVTNDTGFVQIRPRTEDRDVLQTGAGDRRPERRWTVEWEAPAAGAGTVTFYLATNAADGNGKEDAGDRWNKAEITTREAGATAPRTWLDDWWGLCMLTALAGTVFGGATIWTWRHRPPSLR